MTRKTIQKKIFKNYNFLLLLLEGVNKQLKNKKKKETPISPFWGNIYSKKIKAPQESTQLAFARRKNDFKVNPIMKGEELIALSNTLGRRLINQL